MSVSKPRKCGVAKSPSLASQLPFQSSLPIWAAKMEKKNGLGKGLVR
jgi:hypothetical protein